MQPDNLKKQIAAIKANGEQREHPAITQAKEVRKTWKGTNGEFVDKIGRPAFEKSQRK